MNPQQLVVRRIIYFCLVAALLLPIVWLSRPGGVDAQGQRTPGGQLDQLRAKYKLGQDDLGDIDPTSETIKLATLGMRGIAAQVLWSKANEYKKKENWTEFSATLDQIAKIMPNFIGVWRFQAWNLSYNVAVEFDDHRQRYRKAMEGIEFLKKGLEYNRDDTQILVDIGRFISEKIGRSDERELFRGMFRAERMAEGFKDEQDLDSWLVGKQWYLRAQRLVDDQNAPIRGMNSVVFHAQPALNQIHYAKTIQQEGIPLGDARSTPSTVRESAAQKRVLMWKEAWINAARDWFDGPNSFGERALAAGDGSYVRMNDLKRQSQYVREMWHRIDALQPGLAEKWLVDEQDKLTPDERAALRVPKDIRRPEQQGLVDATIDARIEPGDLAARVDANRRDEARRLVGQLANARRQIELIESARSPVNFENWTIRCQAEANDQALAARRHIVEAQQDRRQGRLAAARRAYERAFAAWAAVLTSFPALLEDSIAGSDLMELVLEYRVLVVDRQEEPFPKDFALQNIIERYDDNRVFSNSDEKQTAPPTP